MDNSNKISGGYRLCGLGLVFAILGFAIATDRARAQADPDWLEILTADELLCTTAQNNTFRLRAEEDGSLWTKFGANAPLTGHYTVLEDGSGWERTIERFGTAKQKIRRSGNAIVVAGENGDVRCKPS